MTTTGDKVWTLHEGRCQDILPGQYAGRVDLVVTSPPYDSVRDYAGVGMQAWDFGQVADAVIPALRPGGVICWIVADGIQDGGESGTSMRQALGFMERGLTLHQTLIFQRWNINGMSDTRYFREHEYIYVLSKGRPEYVNLLKDRKAMTPGSSWPKKGAGRKGDPRATYDGTRMITQPYGRRSSIWRYAVGFGCTRMRGGEVANPHDHPAAMPYDLAADLIRSYCPPDGLVLDPMSGSGTVLRAAITLGRTAIGCEVVPEYCDLIRQRLAQPAMIFPED